MSFWWPSMGQNTFGATDEDLEMLGNKNSDIEQRSFESGFKKNQQNMNTNAPVATQETEKPPATRSPVANEPKNHSGKPKLPLGASTSAIIGEKICFKGEIIGEEDLLVQGRVDGTIDLKNHNLIIGKQGVLKANVIAKTITIEGAVEGDIFGQERIAILASSHVKGNLVAERVTLEDGAKFRGSIDMDMNVNAQEEQFNKIMKRGAHHTATPSPKTAAPTLPSADKSTPEKTD